ncbi:hypothetical protein [Pseudovibrio denitrificans]|uniref:hypothetical protein n=1 Tax=Pseudovibrio denitrificans TaxID=258256 RepID=UPI000B23E4ED|nr:hypothetical protein [Pseudovibrio denitrificans]
MIRFLKYLSLYLLFLGVGYALVPGQTEKVAVQIKERKYFEAREDLLRSFDRANSSPEELLQLAEIAEQLGFVEEMHQMHEAYVQQSPDDLWVLRKIELYHRLSGDFLGYVESLKAIARLSLKQGIVTSCSQHCGLRGFMRKNLLNLRTMGLKGF